MSVIDSFELFLGCIGEINALETLCIVFLLWVEFVLLFQLFLDIGF